MSLVHFIVLGGVGAFQLLDAICNATAASTPASVLPEHWCNYNVSYCDWYNVTCYNPYNNNTGALQLKTLTLYDVPLNIPLPRAIDAPGPIVFSITMSNCGLTGTVPPTLVNVTSTLRQLDLSNNVLTGNFPWEFVATRSLILLNLANNAMSGPTLFESIAAAGDGFAVRFLNLANNSFYEEWRNVSGDSFGALFFNIEGNFFSGRAPALFAAIEYNIARNYFSTLETSPYNLSVVARYANLLHCDMSGVPFVEPPPLWALAYYQRCGYTYNPGNVVYNASDLPMPGGATNATLSSMTTTTMNTLSSTDNAQGSATAPNASTSTVAATAAAISTSGAHVNLLTAGCAGSVHEKTVWTALVFCSLSLLL